MNLTVVDVDGVIYSVDASAVRAASNFFQAAGNTYQVMNWEGESPSIREVSLSFIWSHLPVVKKVHLKGRSGMFLYWDRTHYLFPKQFSLAFLEGPMEGQLAVQVEWPANIADRTFAQLRYIFTVSDLPQVLPWAVKI